MRSLYRRRFVGAWRHAALRSLWAVPSLRDKRTGLWGWRVLRGRGMGALARAFICSRLASPTLDTVFVGFDIDGFRDFNQGHGHTAGDSLLAEMGRRLREAAAPWPAFRTGPDEFLVVARLPDDEAVACFVDDVRAVLERPHQGRSVTFSAAAAHAFPRATFQRHFLALDRVMFMSQLWRTGEVWISTGPNPRDAGPDEPWGHRRLHGRATP